jgi:hypothetical protein
VGAKSLSVSGVTYSQVANPDNTKSVMARTYAVQDNGVGNTVGTFTDFCLKCHDGSPPTAVAEVYNYVPYSIIFPTGWRGNITTNVYGWNKSAYTGKGHDTRTILCTDCHKSHGSVYTVLQVYAEDTSTTNGECLLCHRSSGYTGADDVKTDLTRTYRHPTLYVSGKHSDTENYDNMPLADRHAECFDCHDPHRCDSTTAVAPAVYGNIKGASGVLINFGTSNWTSWPGDATFTQKLGIDYEYELCFKCHSYYSYRTSPPTSPSGGFTETDQAKEFNPVHPAYHAVVGTSKIPTFTYNSQTYYYGKFVSPWTATSRLYCTDCHASDTSSIRGPHGSAQKFILKAPWDPNTGSSGNSGTGSSGTSGHLCFKCHDYDFYTGQNSGSATVRSKFSSSSSYNRHDKHQGKGCACCHGAIPHGWHQYQDSTDNVIINGAVWEWNEDGAPYWTGVWLDVNSWRTPGNWSDKAYCNHDNLPSGGNPNSGKSCN